jgi:hypothetical protein
MGGVGDVGQGAADDDAPAGPGRLVGGVHFEGDRLPLGGGIELGPRVGPEDDQVSVEDVVDREDHRAAEFHDGQPAQVVLGQQLAAVGVVELLHVDIGHAGTSWWRESPSRVETQVPTQKGHPSLPCLLGSVDPGCRTCRRGA